MSKPMPTAPNQEFQPPANGPPSYDQALNEGAAQPPPGAAQYKPPQQPGSYGGYGPPPGAAYPPQQYGPAPGMPQQQPGMPQQQQQYGQYGAPPGVHQQPQQYGQYGAPPGGVPVVGAVIQTVPYCGPNPTHMVCPQCHAEIDTSVRASPSTTAWVSGLLIALFGCWMGCCLIPCCMDECMDKEHSCPNCHAYLGKHRR